MAKYIVIEDFESKWMRPPSNVPQVVVFRKGAIIEALPSATDGNLLTKIDGSKPTFAVGEILVDVVESKIKPTTSDENADKNKNMMKWIYLGGAAVMLWWFIYGRNDKKKYSNESAGYAGIKGKKGTKGDIYEYVIPSYALPYIVNNDPSGLSDEEIEKIDKFADEVYQETGSSIEMGIDYDQEPYFKWRNDIDGSLGANVIDVKIRSRK